jgi:putative peptidoglycan lipid II flippase
MFWKLKRLWTRSTTQLTSGAAIIAAASLVSRILGLFRDRILAGEFGAGDTLDVYYAAFRLPDTLYNIVIMGALSAGFIPVFIAARRRHQAKPVNSDHWQLANTFLTVVIVVISVCSVILSLLADSLVGILAPGFSADKQAMVVSLSRVMLLAPILLGMSAVVGGVLQSYRNFFVYSLAPIFYNVGIILGALFFVPRFGYIGLAWGVVLGAAFHFLIQVPALLNLRWRMRPAWQIRTPDMQEIWRMTLPRTLALGAQQINLVLLTVVASYLAAGSLAIFNLATNIAYVPVAIFGIAYALAAFPVLADEMAAKNLDGFRQIFAEAVSRILFFIIPVSILYLILRAQFVRIVLGSSVAFDWSDTILTHQALLWLGLGLTAEALLPLLLRGFYAQRKTLTPLIIVILAGLITIVGSLKLSESYGVAGLTMGVTLGAYFQLLLMWLLLHSASKGLHEKLIVNSLVKFVAAGATMAFVAQGVKTGLGVFLGTTTFLDIALQTGIAATVSLLTYVCVLRLLNAVELAEFIDLARERLFALTLDREGLREEV